MRLAFISLMGGVPFGGSELLWSRTARLALEKGHEVAISVFDWGLQNHPVFSELHSLGAAVNFRPRFSHNMPPVKKIRNYIENRNPRLKKHWRFIAGFRPDHVLINQGDCFDLLVHHYDLHGILQKGDIPYSLLSHNHPQYGFVPGSSIYPRGRNVFIGARNLFFISQHQRKFVEKTLLTPFPEAEVIRNPLNLASNQRLEWPGEKPQRFALVSNLIPGKGHDITFEVLATDRWLAREWELNIYGKGEGEGYLKSLSAYLGLESRVRFHGHVSSATDIWKTNHLLLIPSSGEGFPISMMEAFISGRPVVGTDVGGISEAVREGQTGFLAEAPTVTSFGLAMERAWEKRNQWKGLGKQAHDLYSDLYREPERELLEKIAPY